MPLTNYEANRYIRESIQNGCWIGLLKEDPGYDGDSASEVVAAEYSRQPITFVDPVSGKTQNGEDIVFSVATSNWGTIKYVALFDAEAGGNIISYSKLNYEREIRSADQYMIPISYNIFEIR